MGQDGATARGDSSGPGSKFLGRTNSATGIVEWIALTVGAYLIDRYLPLAALSDQNWAVWWPINGITIALLLITRRRQWPWILSAVTMGSVLSERASTDPASEICWVAVCNCVEVLIPALLLPRFDNLTSWLQKPRLMWKFVLFALILGPLVSSGLSAAYYHSIYHRDFWASGFRWGISDVVGNIMYAPLVLVLISPETYTLFRRGELPRTVGTILLLVASTWFVFSRTNYPIAFIICPIVLLVAIQTGFSGSVIAINILAPIVTAATLHGTGPFSAASSVPEHYRIIMVQSFLVLSMLTAFPISVARVRQQSTAAQLQRAYLRMETLATADGLTGLANRRRFDTALELEWRRALRESRPVALLMLDVDNFKAYNDRYGHPAGDTCLQAIAGAICNIPERGGDLVARYGGEEFVVLLPGTDGEGAYAVAELVRKNVLALRIPHDLNVTGMVTISIGCAAMVPEDAAGPEVLVEASDQALYMAKQGGRNQSLLFVRQRDSGTYELDALISEPLARKTSV